MPCDLVGGETCIFTSVERHYEQNYKLIALSTKNNVFYQWKSASPELKAIIVA